MKKKTEKKLSDEHLFEIELFKALKSYGYLFPENFQEVDRFEYLYGSTEINTPEKIELSEKNSSLDAQKREDINFNISLQSAAFIPNEDNSLNLPEDLPEVQSNDSLIPDKND